MMTTAEAAARRWSRPEWVSVIVAALSLATAIGFNGVQVLRNTQEAQRSTQQAKLNNEQARLSRETAQLQLLNSVGLDYAKARDAGTNSSQARADVNAGRRLGDSEPLFLSVELEITLAERLAYILNEGYVDLPGAVSPGGLVCTWRRFLALAPPYYAKYVYWRHGLPNLRRFAAEHEGKYLCAEPAPPPRPAGTSPIAGVVAAG
jgi:hypothetical protein